MMDLAETIATDGDARSFLRIAYSDLPNPKRLEADLAFVPLISRRAVSSRREAIDYAIALSGVGLTLLRYLQMGARPGRAVGMLCFEESYAVDLDREIKGDRLSSFLPAGVDFWAFRERVHSLSARRLRTPERKIGREIRRHTRVLSAALNGASVDLAFHSIELVAAGERIADFSRRSRAEIEGAMRLAAGIDEIQIIERLGRNQPEPVCPADPVGLGASVKLSPEEPSAVDPASAEKKFPQSSNARLRLRR